VDSERPKPSANAKPLPEHLKESDSSLAITNRTDGVPEIGDPFQDPNSTEKWAEFNTAPEVTQKVAKTDLNKPNKLWYYLGKTSTEARPQYTDNPAIQKHNTKSNFLDTVKPAPLPIPIARQSYPASYPIQPSPLSIPPRTPMQQQQQQQQQQRQQQHLRPGEKPYQYKPRTDATWKSPVYNYSPDTRKNPNSPVAHQPNVVYDHRAVGPQYGHPSHSNGHHQHRPSQTNFHHYSPPQTSSGWKPSQTTGPLPSGIDQYAKGSQPSPYSYHQTVSSNGGRQLPPSQYGQFQGQPQRPVYSPPTQHNTTAQSQLQPHSAAAPLAGILSNPTGTSKPPGYAKTPSSSLSTTHSPLPQSEYLAYVTKYPYLRNAFLRRAKTYVSPYSPDGGFTPEWTSKVNGSTTPIITPRPPSSSGRPAHGLGLSFSAAPPATLPPPRPMPQFQSSDAFQRDMANAPATYSGMPRWESMMKQLATSTASPAQSSATASTGSQPPAPRPSGISHEVPANTTIPIQSYTPPPQSTTPPFPPPNEPQRPIPSPISDAAKSPKRPEYSPISDDGKGPVSKASLASAPQAHLGETWRYS
jgi:hypothetical protein